MVAGAPLVTRFTLYYLFARLCSMAHMQLAIQSVAYFAPEVARSSWPFQLCLQYTLYRYRSQQAADSPIRSLSLKSRSTLSACQTNQPVQSDVVSPFCENAWINNTARSSRDFSFRKFASLRRTFGRKNVRYRGCRRFLCDFAGFLTHNKWTEMSSLGKWQLLSNLTC